MEVDNPGTKKHLPRNPQELVRSDNQIAYVTCDQSKQVAVIDLLSRRLQKLTDVGGAPMVWVGRRQVLVSFFTNEHASFVNTTVRA
jgi:hypothetical protein